MRTTALFIALAALALAPLAETALARGNGYGNRNGCPGWSAGGPMTGAGYGPANCPAYWQGAGPGSGYGPGAGRGYGRMMRGVSWNTSSPAQTQVPAQAAQ
ncbi:hypothetical protein [Fundidesulfovibrio soli]|uniref:hypothetical protein n=1 Tax=Fundidesulfovibrio soli TaxID=2922716 RepID=UPI001FB02E26|nr:hypothetical protein [Fundidesulfovibrio soli]